MMRRAFSGILAVGCSFSLFFACTSEELIYGGCRETGAACPGAGDINGQPKGSICSSSGQCICPGDTVKCCANGKPGECVAECPGGLLCPNTNDGGTDAPPVAACSSDAECPQPESPECGEGRCVAGTCHLEINEGPTPSQFYGDCKRRVCDAAGAVRDVLDSSDFYDDGEQCTVDYCDSENATNSSLPDGLPCPKSSEGYCYQRTCVECIQSVGGATCGGGGLVCDFLWCVPFAQCNSGQCGGACAPCAVGSSPCSDDADCISNSCVGGMCVLGTCEDGSKNNEETDVDCGGGCPPCANDARCKFPSDCSSQVCKTGICQTPTCFDAVQNGGETGVDCGPSPCDPCK